LDNEEVNSIINEIKDVVSKWKVVATNIGISKREQELMGKAFNI